MLDANGLELVNKLQRERVAKECAEWIERKVDIKAIKQTNLLHGKMYHVATQGVEDAILAVPTLPCVASALATAATTLS